MLPYANVLLLVSHLQMRFCGRCFLKIQNEKLVLYTAVEYQVQRDPAKTGADNTALGKISEKD